MHHCSIPIVLSLALWPLSVVQTSVEILVLIVSILLCTAFVIYQQQPGVQQRQRQARLSLADRPPVLVSAAIFYFIHFSSKLSDLSMPNKSH